MTNPQQPLRVMSVMAHQDDFEFNAGGSFALLSQTLGDDVKLGVLTTTNGASGHHLMTAEETVARRDHEARAAAALIGAEYELLKTLEGKVVGDGQFLISRNLLGGLWNAIRRFRADVVFCPPIVTDPLAGVHIDHEQTALAMRYVGYQLGVPRAYPTLEGEVDMEYRSPLIINVDDVYNRALHADIRQNIETVYDLKLKMSLCHTSQVLEWLPFVNRNDDATAGDWAARFRLRHHEINRRYGFEDDTPSEYFRITHWGRAPRAGELEQLFPQRLPVQEGS
jgi:LmbE family N-acetylglucosaminyl deacetylase